MRRRSRGPSPAPPPRRGNNVGTRQITLRGLGPSEKSMKRFQGKGRSVTLKHDRRGTAEVVGRVMLVISGWTNYFRLSRPTP